jgi:uncharacterized RDD family membrane protein YckC
MRHAGFWLRFVAELVDLFVLAIPFSCFVSFLSVGMGVWKAYLDLGPGKTPAEVFALVGHTFIFYSLAFFIVLSWLYFAGFESSRWRATLGKRLLGLYLADESGNPISFWQASLRFFSGRLLAHVPVVGNYYFILDCALIGVTPAKRAIHDLLSGTLVLREDNDTFMHR